jgi:hypothetical protein
MALDFYGNSGTVRGDMKYHLVTYTDMNHYHVYASHEARATALISELTDAGLTIIDRVGSEILVEGTPDQINKFIENYRAGVDFPPIYGTGKDRI